MSEAGAPGAGDPFLDAAMRVLREEDGGPLHWTVIQDLALRRSYLDPFTQPDVRKHLLAALSLGVEEGLLAKDRKGTYRLSGTAPDGAGATPAAPPPPG